MRRNPKIPGKRRRRTAARTRARTRRSSSMPDMGKQAALLWNGLVDLLYPPVCLVCRAEQPEALCPLCVRAIQPIPPPFCDRCGEPVAAADLVCRRCEIGPEPPFAWSQALGRYEGVLREAIQLLKYS